MIRTKYRQVQFTPVEQLSLDTFLETRWLSALLRGDGLEVLLDRLSWTLALSRRIEPFLVAWLHLGPQLHSALAQLAKTIWHRGLPEPLVKVELEHWLLTEVLQFLRAGEAQLGTVS